LPEGAQEGAVPGDVLLLVVVHDEVVQLVDLQACLFGQESGSFVEMAVEWILMEVVQHLEAGCLDVLLGVVEQTVDDVEEA